MRAIAVGKGGVFGPSAKANRGVDMILCRKRNGLKRGSDVRIIAEGRVIGESACAV
jgi:hypothetical protein